MISASTISLLIIIAYCRMEMLAIALVGAFQWILLSIGSGFFVCLFCFFSLMKIEIILGKAGEREVI